MIIFKILITDIYRLFQISGMPPRILKISATYLRHRIYHRHLRIWQSNGFGTGPNSANGDDAGMVGRSVGPPFISRASLMGRRPLSPLERVSQLVPPESLSQEVWDLRRNNPEDEEKEPQVEQSPETLNTTSDPGEHAEDGSVETELPSCTVSRERVLGFGEVLLAEYRRKRRLEFQKMFHLEKGGKLMSNWGVIAHEAIEGHNAGTIIRTSLGLPILIRRPSLEEFTLFMKRGPAIAYPKDANAMLMMMDVNEGDRVLESGSGSGAMSLFLSRAVGSRGSVLSVEVREDHQRRAVLNYQRWCVSWKLRTGCEWPDNVSFQLEDLTKAYRLLDGQSFNSIALDMVNPHLALPTVVPHLHTGGVCAVYQANVTQIVDLMEGLRCSDVPLVCERIIEVQYRDWLISPSLKKDGSFNQRKAPGEPDGDRDTDDDSNERKEQLESFPFGSVPYIARPHPEQTAHTAFLVKLRKISS